MAPLKLTNAAQPSGSTLLSWTAVPEATGYLATLFGGKMGPGGQMGDMVMWTSSASRQFGGGLSDWLTPAQVAGLVRDRTRAGTRDHHLHWSPPKCAPLRPTSGWAC